ADIHSCGARRATIASDSPSAHRKQRTCFTRGPGRSRVCLRWHPAHFAPRLSKAVRSHPGGAFASRTGFHACGGSVDGSLVRRGTGLDDSNCRSGRRFARSQPFYRGEARLDAKVSGSSPSGTIADTALRGRTADPKLAEHAKSALRLRDGKSLHFT